MRLAMALTLLVVACGGDTARPWVEGCWRGDFIGQPFAMRLDPPPSPTSEADSLGVVRLAVSDSETLLGTVAAFAVGPRSAVLRMSFDGFYPVLAWVYPSGPGKMTGAATGAGLEAEAFTWIRYRCSP